MGAEGYHRRKAPERVRRAILDAAGAIAIGGGMQALTIQAVADRAGVTKGGLFHHFQSRQALLEAMFADLAGRVDEMIDAHIAVDPVERGIFSRAYVAVMLSAEGMAADSPVAVLMVAMMAERSLDGAWGRWMAARLARHSESDSAPVMELVRYAADGAWLNHAGSDMLPDFAELRERLFALTREG